METLAPAQRRALRARAHHLHPVVSIGQHGLTPGVLKEIDVNLKAHELIKIRVFGDARAGREAMLARICAELDAAAVQHLGRLLIVWRPAPPDGAPVVPARRPAEKSAAKKAPQVRRPRSPLPRAPARPPRGKTPFTKPGALKERRRGAGAASKPVPGGDRSRRRATAKAAPHGKSTASSAGAAGARRRRKAR